MGGESVVVAQIPQPRPELVAVKRSTESLGLSEHLAEQDQVLVCGCLLRTGATLVLGCRAQFDCLSVVCQLALAAGNLLCAVCVVPAGNDAGIG